MRFRRFVFWACLAFGSVGISQAEERVVSGGGAITETIYALGAERELVAVDTTSYYPEEAKNLPKIGYARQLSAEGILSIDPTLVFVNEDAGPPAVLKQLDEAGIKVVRMGGGHSPEGAVQRIAAIGKALGREGDAQRITDELNSEIRAAQKQAASTSARPRVLFIYARGGGALSVSGKNTAADAMIALAGGVNAVSEYEGYKPLSAEGAVEAAPDFILMTSSGLAGEGGVDALLKQPGLADTPAGKARRVIAMDGLYLLGFGPRLGKAVAELCGQLHPEADFKKDAQTDAP